MNRIIEVEGIDASGKTTLATNLAVALRGKDKRVLHLGFPDHNSVTGKVLRAWLRKEWTTGDQYIDALTFQCLQIVNRLDLLPPEDKMPLYDHIVVDRYWTSGLVYGHADGLDLDWLIHAQGRLPKPDISFHVMVPVPVALERKKGKFKDRYEENSDYIQKVAGLYEKVFARLRQEPVPTKFHEIDGTQTEEEVLASAIRIIEESE